MADDKCLSCRHSGLGPMHPCIHCVHSGKEDYYQRAEICKNCSHAFNDEQGRSRCHKKKRRLVSRYGSCDKWAQRGDLL